MSLCYPLFCPIWRVTPVLARHPRLRLGAGTEPAKLLQESLLVPSGGAEGEALNEAVPAEGGWDVGCWGGRSCCAIE